MRKLLEKTNVVSTFTSLICWAENSPAGRASCHPKATPRGAHTTHNPLNTEHEALHYLPNLLLSSLTCRGVSCVTRKLPHLSQPDCRGGWLVNGSRLTSQKAHLSGTCGLSTGSWQSIRSKIITYNRIVFIRLGKDLN